MFGDIKVKSRPLRLAFLIGPKLAALHEAIKINSTRWGGAYITRSSRYIDVRRRHGDSIPTKRFPWFNRSVQHRLQSIGWRLEAQGLSRTLIEPQSNRVQITLRDAREIGSSREVLPQQAVGVLV